MGQRFESVRPEHGFVDWLLRMGRTTDVYIGVAPRTERRGCREAVDRVHVAWADCDSPESIEALEHFEPRPSLIIASGSGRHAYWSLWPPAGVDAIERANRRLRYALGADNATDAARVLRPPGTFNHKTDPARTVQIERLGGEVYALAEVVGHLPDPPTAPVRETPTRAREVEDDDVVASLRAIEPAGYVETLTGRAVGRDGKVCCPFHPDSTPSLHVYGPDKGWTCFGCEPPPDRQNLGGDIFTFAGRLWGIDPHEGFLELRDRLADRLLGGAG